jgi:hypothetical protein
MKTLAGQRMFTVGHVSWIWEDVVLAGVVWGDWAALERRVRTGLACLARLDDLDDDDEDALDEADVETAAAEFRYARDLVAAADLEAWLQRRGLSVDAWLDYIRRALLLERWAADLDEIVETYELDDAEVAEAVVCEAVCSGVAADLAARLAARAAVAARDAAQPLGDDVPVETPDAAEGLARALPDMPASARRERARALAALDAAWRRFTGQLATPEALRALIGARGLDWVRVVVRGVLAPDEDTAHEMALCVREDGRTLEEVAVEAGRRAETLEWWLEELDGPLRDALVGAGVGDVLGPLPWREHQLVLVVDAKRLPVEADPAVQARAERALLARTVDREVAGRVTWQATL